VILKNLAQESPKSDLRLRRYGEKKLQRFFVISAKWLGYFWKYVENLMSSQNFHGLWLDFTEG
jgi:hypothetical protein